MAVTQGPLDENPTQEQLPKPKLPTPIVSPLPLPVVNQTLRNVTAGSPSVVNPVIAQAQQAMQQLIADRNRALVANPPTPAGPVLSRTEANLARGRGTGVQNRFITDVARNIGLELGPSIFGGPSTADPRSPAFRQPTPASPPRNITGARTQEQQDQQDGGFDAALAEARIRAAEFSDPMNTIEAAAGHVAVALGNGYSPPFIMYEVQEHWGWTDAQMKAAGYVRGLGGWKLDIGSEDLPVTTSSGEGAGGAAPSWSFPSLGNTRNSFRGSSLINWRI